MEYALPASRLKSHLGQAGLACVDIAVVCLLLHAGKSVQFSQLGGFAVAIALHWAALGRACVQSRPASSTWGLGVQLLGVAMASLLLRSAVLALLVGRCGWQTQFAIVLAVPAGLLVLFGTGPLLVSRHEPAKAWRNFVVALTVYSCALRLLYAGSVDLLPEETYYWSYSQHLDIGYLDHPPLVAWLIRMSTTVLGQTEFAVRAGAIFCGALTSFFVYRLTRNVFGDAAALASLAPHTGAAVFLSGRFADDAGFSFDRVLGRLPVFSGKSIGRWQVHSMVVRRDRLGIGLDIQVHHPVTGFLGPGLRALGLSCTSLAAAVSALCRDTLCPRHLRTGAGLERRASLDLLRVPNLGKAGREGTIRAPQSSRLGDRTALPPRRTGVGVPICPRRRTARAWIPAVGGGDNAATRGVFPVQSASPGEARLDRRAAGRRGSPVERRHARRTQSDGHTRLDQCRMASDPRRTGADLRCRPLLPGAGVAGGRLRRAYRDPAGGLA